MSTETRILPFKDWPAPDQEMWHRATQQGGLFDDIGPLAHLAAPSQDMIERGYGKWLGWLSRIHPEALALSPADRIALETFLSFVEAMCDLSPPTQHFYAATTLRLLSRCHPERAWEPWRRIVRHLQRQADAHDSHRKDGRILSGAHVLKRAIELEASVSRDGINALQPALTQRNATIFAFLALIPLRRRALANLSIGTSVVRDGDDILIVTGPELTKTNTYWETLVPKPLAPLMERCIMQTRPWLMARCREDHGFLWVTKDGEPLTGSALGTMFRIQTPKIFGVALSPHLFRDIAATTLARTSPEAVGHLRALLGHRGHETAETYYNHANALEVGRCHARLIDNLKKGD